MFAQEHGDDMITQEIFIAEGLQFRNLSPLAFPFNSWLTPLLHFQGDQLKGTAAF